MPTGVYERKPRPPQKNATKVYENLHFPIAKRHKTKTKYQWKKQGIIFDEIGHTFAWWYETYIYATHCSCCNKKFNNSRDRQLEHNHNIKDAFNVRGIVCNGCNHITKDVKIQSNNKSGEKYIYFDKSRNKWAVRINREDCKFHKYCKSKEEAIIERNKFINDDPNFYSIK